MRKQITTGEKIPTRLTLNPPENHIQVLGLCIISSRNLTIQKRVRFPLDQYVLEMTINWVIGHVVFFFFNHVRGVYDCFSTSYALFILALHSRDGGKGRGGKYLMYSIKYILNFHNVECTISASSKFQK